MDNVLRAIAVYSFMLLIFRLGGKRTLAQITTFDFVLLLIIGESTQQALIGNDFSITTAFILIATLIGIEIGVSLVTSRWKGLSKLVDSVPLVIVEDGKILKDRARKERIDESDVLEAARRFHGLERLEQIKYAVLERDGGITVVPKADAAWRDSFAPTKS